MVAARAGIRDLWLHGILRIERYDPMRMSPILAPRGETRNFQTGPGEDPSRWRPHCRGGLGWPGAPGLDAAALPELLECGQRVFVPMGHCFAQPVDRLLLDLWDAETLGITDS